MRASLVVPAHVVSAFRRVVGDTRRRMIRAQRVSAAIRERLVQHHRDDWFFLF